jgi:hypothetical protein
MTSSHAQAMLGNAIHRSMQQALQTNRSYTETLAEQSVRDGEAVGFINISGGRESVTDISFPLTFTEKPIFTAGLELPDNVWLQWGAFPQWSATVVTWATANYAGTIVYTGCTLGVVVIGPPSAILHYRFAARSYTNPVTSNGAVTSIL